MKRIPKIVDLLLDRPDWSNAAIARVVGCDRRRVRRYRWLLDELGKDASSLKGKGAEMLNAILNSPPGVAARHPVPNFLRLERDWPGRSGKELWDIYRRAQARAGRTAMSYETFMRCKRKATS